VSDFPHQHVCPVYGLVRFFADSARADACLHAEQDRVQVGKLNSLTRGFTGVQILNGKKSSHKYWLVERRMMRTNSIEYARTGSRKKRISQPKKKEEHDADKSKRTHAGGRQDGTEQGLTRELATKIDGLWSLAHDSNIQ
jgi:hypothetical protein